jgi:hypothetical protein
MRIINKATGILTSYIPDLDGDDMGMLFRAQGSRKTRPKAWMFFNTPLPIQYVSSFAQIFE